MYISCDLVMYHVICMYFDTVYYMIICHCRHLFHQEGGAEVSCAAYHGPTHLLVVGFTSGIFTLHEMPDFNLIHSLRYMMTAKTSMKFQ